MSTTKVTDALRNVTEVDAAKLTGSVDVARLPSTVVNSNVDLTTLSASNLTSGTVATARLGSGTASSSTFLRGDSTYTAAGGAWAVTASGTVSSATFLVVALTAKITRIHWHSMIASSGDKLNLQVSPDTGSSYRADLYNLTGHRHEDDTAGTGNISSTATTHYNISSADMSQTGGEAGAGTITIYAAGSSSYYTTFISFCRQFENGSKGIGFWQMGAQERAEVHDTCKLMGPTMSFTYVVEELN